MTPLELRVPGDKSIAHRAIILGALAEGDSRVANLPDGADIASSIAMMRAFGVTIDRDGDRALVRGRGSAALRAPAAPIDCGNSGTTARLGIGLAAAIEGTTTFIGDDSLSARPMERVVEPLRAAGARVVYLGTEGRLPIEVTGGTLEAVHDRSTTASAQVKSALLIAGLAAGVDTSVGVAPSRDHTERMLRSMGLELSVSDHSSPTVSRMILMPRRPYRLAPLDLDIPGDASSAAFLVAASLLAAVPVTIRDVGLNPGRTGFLDVVRRMGARIDLRNERERGGEPVGDIVVEPGPLRGTTVRGDEIVRTIDELPLVGILGAHAAGETVVEDALELRAKESDRIDALVTNLKALGVDADDRYSGFAVRGADRRLVGRVRSYGDHRIAMAFTVLGLRPGSGIEVDDMSVARVSFPGFAEAIDRLRDRPATIGEPA